MAIVGAGRVGTALGVLLVGAGHRVAAAWGRDATRERLRRFLPGVPILPPHQAAAAGSLVILAVPDDHIESTCQEIAAQSGFWQGQSVVHLSGSLPLDVLAEAREMGARVLSIHPLQTFPDVDTAVGRLPGSGMAVTAEDEEGYELGERLARDVGGRPFRIPDDVKPLYHAAAVFCSNYLATVVGLAEHLFLDAGLEDPRPLFAPLAEATLANVLSEGPGNALTGPAVRADVGTIQRNLEALSKDLPAAVPVYVALAGVALDLAQEAGRLSRPERTRVEKALKPWK